MSMEDDFIAKGRPIEGAFRSMLEAAYFRGLDTEERQFLWKIFFAGARAAMAGPDNPNNVLEHWAIVNAELNAFGRRLVTELPTKGRA